MGDKLWGKIYSKLTQKIFIVLDSDAWEDAIKLYKKLDGGKLNHRIRVIKIPKDADVAELGGVEDLEPITLL